MTFLGAAVRSAFVLAVVAGVSAACETSSNDGASNPAGGGGAFGVDASFDGAPGPGIPEAGASDAPPDVGSSLDAGDASSALDAASLLDVFVDPTAGLDTQAGTAAAPFKTIKKALSVVPVGSTVWLADGSYNAANQGGAGALVLPDGARVSALHVGLAILEGLPVTASAASGTLLGVVLDQGSTLTASNTVAVTPTFTLVDVLFKSRALAGATLSVAGKTKVSASQTSFNGPLPSLGILNLTDSAELLLTGGTIDGGGSGTAGFGYQLISVKGTSKLTLDGVTMKSSMAAGILVAGSTSAAPAVVALRNGTVLDGLGSAGNCAAGGSVVVVQNADVTVDASEIKNALSAGICVRNGAASNIALTLKNSAKLTNDIYAVRSEPGTSSEITLVVNGASFTSNAGSGIYFDGSGSFDLTATTMTGNGSGLTIYSSVATTVKARSSTFSNNTQLGLALTTSGPLTVDLGTAASQGKNTLTGNVITGLRLDVPAAQTHSAVGNTWNASVQSADAAGHFTDGTDVVGPMNGTSYVLVNASTLTL